MTDEPEAQENEPEVDVIRDGLWKWEDYANGRKILDAPEPKLMEDEDGQEPDPIN